MLSRRVRDAYAAILYCRAAFVVSRDDSSQIRNNSSIQSCLLGAIASLDDLVDAQAS